MNRSVQLSQDGLSLEYLNDGQVSETIGLDRKFHILTRTHPLTLVAFGEGMVTIQHGHKTTVFPIPNLKFLPGETYIDGRILIDSNDQYLILSHWNKIYRFDLIEDVALEPLSFDHKLLNLSLSRDARYIIFLKNDFRRKEFEIITFAGQSVLKNDGHPLGFHPLDSSRFYYFKHGTVHLVLSDLEGKTIDSLEFTYQKPTFEVGLYQDLVVHDKVYHLKNDKFVPADREKPVLDSHYDRYLLQDFGSQSDFRQYLQVSS